MSIKTDQVFSRGRWITGEDLLARGEKLLKTLAENDRKHAEHVASTICKNEFVRIDEQGNTILHSWIVPRARP